MPAFYVVVSEDYRELREFHGLGIWGNRDGEIEREEERRRRERSSLGDISWIIGDDNLVLIKFASSASRRRRFFFRCG